MTRPVWVWSVPAWQHPVHWRRGRKGEEEEDKEEERRNWQRRGGRREQYQSEQRTGVLVALGRQHEQQVVCDKWCKGDECGRRYHETEKAEVLWFLFIGVKKKNKKIHAISLVPQLDTRKGQSTSRCTPKPIDNGQYILVQAKWNSLKLIYYPWIARNHSPWTDTRRMTCILLA